MEFFDSETDDLFVNGTFGWPAIKATNLPAGGRPADRRPGVRVKAKLGEQVTAFAAIFNGTSAPPDVDGDPQRLDNHGLAWRVGDPPWLIGQVRYEYREPGAAASPATLRRADGITSESSTISADRRRAVIADPTGSGIARKLRRNFGVFAVIEQAFYRPPPVGKTKGAGAKKGRHRVRARGI